jgi:hypothetical protein
MIAASLVSRINLVEEKQIEKVSLVIKPKEHAVVAKASGLQQAYNRISPEGILDLRIVISAPHSKVHILRIRNYATISVPSLKF